MLRRVPQPPVQPASRAIEARGFWPGLVAGLIGFASLAVGAAHLTTIPTTDGDRAREMELVRAFAYGGLRHGEAAPMPPRPTGDPVYDMAAMERWQKDISEHNSKAAKLRVDTGAKAACPT